MEWVDTYHASSKGLHKPDGGHPTGLFLRRSASWVDGDVEPHLAALGAGDRRIKVRLSLSVLFTSVCVLFTSVCVLFTFVCVLFTYVWLYVSESRCALCHTLYQPSSVCLCGASFCAMRSLPSSL